MTPSRRLLLVRDVTAGRVADRTIRSLFQFLQDRDEDRTRLLRRTNAAIEAERNRIARDLHDGPVQGVSAASLSLEAALLMVKAGETERGMEVLTKIRRELAEEADGLRSLMAGLRPPVLEERGLIPALRETLMRFEEDHGLTVRFSGTLSAELPDDLETLAYRVVQEALSNVAKHSGAERIDVTVGSRSAAPEDRDRRRRARVRCERDPGVPALGQGRLGLDARARGARERHPGRALGSGTRNHDRRNPPGGSGAGRTHACRQRRQLTRVFRTTASSPTCSFRIRFARIPSGGGVGSGSGDGLSLGSGDGLSLGSGDGLSLGSGDGLSLGDGDGDGVGDATGCSGPSV